MNRRSQRNTFIAVGRHHITTMRGRRSTHCWWATGRTDGGRGRTRTCDLLLLKPAPCFLWLHGILPVLWFFNNMGSLLFAQRQVPQLQRNAVLIRFSPDNSELSDRIGVVSG